MGSVATNRRVGTLEFEEGIVNALAEPRVAKATKRRGLWNNMIKASSLWVVQQKTRCLLGVLVHQIQVAMYRTAIAS
jgi:hypothetical protein